MVENLEVYTSVQKWLTKLQAKSRSFDFDKSSTRRAGLYWLKQYCKFLGSSPDRPSNPNTIIAERMQQIQNPNLNIKRTHEEFVEAYVIHLKNKDYAPNTISTAVGLIRSFYKASYGGLDQVASVRPYTIRLFKIPTIKDIKKMCAITDPETKAWILCQKDSGLGNTDLIDLSLANLSSEYGTIGQQLRKGTIPIHIELRRQKTGERIHSFFGPNAIEALKEYVNIHERTSKIFNMQMRTVQQRVKALGIKAKISTQEVPVTPYCVTPKMTVITNPSVKEIADISDGTLVLTHKGRYVESHKMERTYEGEILRILPYYTNLPIEVTPEHLILSGDGDAQKWIPARELNVGDLVLSPRITAEEEITIDLALLLGENVVIPRTDGDLIRPKIGIVRNTIIRHLKINERIGRLIGYFLAEGCTNRRGLYICFNSTEKDYIQDTIDIIQEEFGFDGHYLVGRGGVYFASRLLAEFFEELFGKYAYYKRLPIWAFKLPQKIKWEIIKGILIGDGHIRNRYRKSTPLEQIDTTSRTLAFQIKLMLNSLGVIVSVCHKAQRGMMTSINGKLVISKHDIYNIYTASESWSAFASGVALNIPHSERPNPRSKNLLVRQSRQMRRTHILPDYVATKIAKIEKIPYQGLVYDLSVPTDTSYVCQGIVVHNSFRKAFNSYLKFGDPSKDIPGVNEALVELMMGHSIGRVRSAYLVAGQGSTGTGVPISKLAEIYMKTYPAIDITLV